METSYQKLDVRKKSIELVDDIYKVTSSFPKLENYGLVDQMKRSAVSIPSNIAEGDQRNTRKENINFLYIAKGSSAELQTQLIISHRNGFIDNKEFEILDRKILEVLKMLSGLISYKKQQTS